MNRIHFLFIGVLLMVSCQSDMESVRAKGDRYYGGEFSFISPERVTNLFPLATNDVHTQRVNAQLFESLLRLDGQTMKIEPGLAQSYTVDRQQNRYTFKLRKGVLFHDDPCFEGESREMKAEDVKFSLEMACSGLSLNKLGASFSDRIKGASDFYQRSRHKIPAKGVEGIVVLDEYTIQIQLERAYIGFEHMLTMSNLGIFPKVAYAYYGKELVDHPIGTGPFQLKQLDKNALELIKNPDYWRKDEFGNQLPFLDKIHMRYNPNKQAELRAFHQKEIDIVLQIPVDEIEFVLGSLKEAKAGKNVRHRVFSQNSLSIEYIAFSCTDGIFSNEQVRRALNKAIDRQALINDWLKGEGWPATAGVAPSIGGFMRSSDADQEWFDVDQAKRELAAAGYPGWNGFPRQVIYVNAFKGSSLHRMCQGIVDQWRKHLGIDVDIKLCTLEERNRAIASGKAKIWRSGWIADYPDAENFFSLFYSRTKNRSNPMHYHRDAFNHIFDQVTAESDRTKRIQLLKECDQIIQKDAPIIPILTNDFLIMVNSRIRNFKTNPMELLDFSTIFIREPRQL